MEDVKQKSLNEEEAFKLITEKLKGQTLPSLQRIPQMERREAIKQLKGIESLSIRQIASITGLTYHEVYTACKDRINRSG